MADDLFEKYPHRPYLIMTELVRSLCGRFGLELADEPDSPAWRFLALKEAAKQPAIDAVLTDSLARIRSVGRCRRRFAVIAPMPPSETGLANATVQTYKSYDAGVDIFTRFEDAYGYSAFMTESVRSEFGFEVFDIGSLPLAIENRGYEAIIVTIGNSIHNRFVAAQLSTFANFKIACPIFVHLHDPWLHDIWAWVAASRNRSAATDLAMIYGGRMRTRFDRKAAFEVGALGLAAIIADAPIAGIIVNSIAAETLVIREYALAKKAIPIIRGFHPVFPPTVPVPPDRPDGRPLVVGTFGVPGHSKRTEIVYAAVKSLVERGVAAQLVLAGYGISGYLNRNRRFDRTIIRSVDAPSDQILQTLMAEIDVAVQLRRKGLGESSGVVPQLLALERPVVVSSVGSFIEYGDAVVQIDRVASADVVAVGILRASKQRGRLRDVSRVYCEKHAPAQFMRILESTTAAR